MPACSLRATAGQPSRWCAARLWCSGLPSRSSLIEVRERRLVIGCPPSRYALRRGSLRVGDTGSPSRSSLVEVRERRLVIGCPPSRYARYGEAAFALVILARPAEARS